jgi:hypothetical protein
MREHRGFGALPREAVTGFKVRLVRFAGMRAGFLS